MNGDENNHETHGNQGFCHVYLEPEIYAVVWSAKSLTVMDDKKAEYHLPLNLGYRVELEDFQRIIPVSAFFKPCFGMLNICGLPGQFDKNLSFVFKRQTKQMGRFLSVQ
jgi:hypothetical protein